MLSEKLFNLPSFQKQYQALLKMSASDQVPNLRRLEKRETLKAQIDWKNIVSIASVLSFSENPECTSAALRIVQACLYEKDCAQDLKNACGLILENMTDQQGLSLALKKNLLSENYAQFLSLPAQISRLSVLMGSHIYFHNQLLPVNHFQKHVFDKFLAYKSLSISAPTSAGKSFILSRLLLSSILDQKKKCIVYVVPSRALIAQVERDLRDLIVKNEIKKVTISSIPPRESLKKDQIYIFVFTQERLHWFLYGDYYLPIDFIIVDEAQKIEDKGRGILLQETVERVASLNPNIFLVFASPFTKNPEIFFNDFELTQKYGVVDTNFISVNQNLYYLDQKIGNPKHYDVTLITGKGHYSLGEVVLPLNAKSNIEKLSSLAIELSEKADSSLIYANGKVVAENIAIHIARSLPEITDNKALDQLIDLVKKVIHPKYRLVQSLSRGVAFHYSNLPLIVRNEIEKLFSEGILRFLVCTSTLLEGVNTPAKNLFLLNPKKGGNEPLSNADFWNLVGRAGRAGMEFCGNIYCINPQKWKASYSDVPEPKKIENSLHKIINDESFKKWLDTEEKSAPLGYESALGYCFIRFLEKKNLPKINNPKTQSKLLEILEKQSYDVEIPSRVLVKNFSISPLKQQALLDEFKKFTGQTVQKLFPLNPKDSEAYPRYIFIIRLIKKAFSLSISEKQEKRLVTLALQWMKGYPLWRIINGALKNKENDEKKQAEIIRNTMKAIEEEIRFQFLSYLTCYTDILKFYIAKYINSEAPESISDVCLWLELGVSKPEQVSLMQMGLSRSTSIEVLRLIEEKSEPNDELINKLKEISKTLREHNIPEAMCREVEGALEMSNRITKVDK